MTGRVYIEIQAEVSGSLLAIRDQIQDLNPEIEWIYDDAVQILEMSGYQKWWDAEEKLLLLSARFPDLGLSWEITRE